MAPGSPPDYPVRGLVPLPRTGRLFVVFSPLPRSPWHRVHPRTNPVQGASAVLHSVASDAPVLAPIRGVFLSHSLSCLGRCRAPIRGVFLSPGSPPDDPVRGLVPCIIPPRMLQSGASFCRILSAASDAPVRGTGFTPGRSSPGASAVLLSAPDAPNRGVFLSYSLRCLGRFTSPPALDAPIRGSFYRILSVASDAPARPGG